MHISILITYIISVFFLVASPGPVLANTLDTSIRKGTQSGFFSIIASNLASLVLISCAILILTGVIALDENYLFWMSIVGCLFIAYIAIKNLYEQLTSAKLSPQIIEFKPPSEKKVSHFKSLKKGFLISIANPKDILFFISFFPQFIHITDNFYQSAGLLTITWIILDIGILSLYVLAMRKELAQKYQKQISLLSNLLLLVIAIGGLYFTLSS